MTDIFDPQNDNDKTVVVSDKTVVAGDKTMVASDKTVVAGDRTMMAGAKTVVAGERTMMASAPVARKPLDRSERVERTEASVTTGSEFMLKEVAYTNVRCLSDSSGEAQVFLVERNGEQSVLKLYYPNFRVNKNLLKVVHNFDFEMIMNVYDYGYTYVDGARRFYERMEYLTGGTLDEYKLNGDLNRFRRIALQTAAALEYCHRNNILHKDIKPSNFFFRDNRHEQVVLGDFGISSMLEKDGKVHRTTQARTPIYAAPEMYADVIDGVVEITPAADFYSLGMTLFALWLGENPMSSNERVMMRQKSEGRLPRLNELPDTVKTIVQGMTAVNPLSRWSYEQVEKWFLGEEVSVDLSSPFLKYRSFIVDPDRNIVADNLHELVPLLQENERLAIRYLYGGRISQWLESCGNTKLSTLLSDLVTNRYPVDQQAGFTAAIYLLEPTYPYKDATGMACDDIHGVALTLLQHIDEYSLLLRNRNDKLFLFLEARTSCNVDRLRSYFETKEGEDEADRIARMRVAVLRTVYEIDATIPFLPKYQSSTLQDVIAAFGEHDCSEDEWHSIIDGRLLSWLYAREDRMVCETLRILTKDRPYSKEFAYKVLYNVDRDAAFDLKSAKTQQEVGEVIAEHMTRCQQMTEAELKETMRYVTDAEGRFHQYAQLHGWSTILTEAARCFDFESEENTERMGIYDMKMAMYRFIRILGATPSYRLENGEVLNDGRNIPMEHQSLLRAEIRNGSLMQWMAAFFHEDPFADFSEQYSYENMLVEWLCAVGQIEPRERHFKRFVEARDVTAKKMDDVRNFWMDAKKKEHIWRTVFYTLGGIFVLLVLIFGVSNKWGVMSHSISTIGLPLGGMTAVIMGVRAFFKGYGITFCIFWGALGALSSLIPILCLKYVCNHYPDWFNAAVILVTLAYMLVCMLTDFRNDTKQDSSLVAEVFNDDIQATLMEPLYYTFKARAARYKGSKFGLMDDVSDQVKALTGESLLHYVMWSILMGIFVVMFVLFSPKLLNMNQPNVNHWHVDMNKVVTDFKRDIE